MSSSRNRIEHLTGGSFIFAHISVCKVAGGLHEGILLQYFIRWAQNANGGWAFRTEAEIEADTMLNRHFQRKARATLVSKGLLDEDRRGVPARNYYQVSYGLLDELLAERSDDDGSCPSSQETCSLLDREPLPDKTGEGFPANKEDTVEEPKKTISRANPQKSTSYTPEFDEFWAKYPRGRGSKTNAYAEWKRIPEPERPAMLSGLTAWLTCPQWADLAFVPYAERFIKRRQWENPPHARIDTPRPDYNPEIHGTW